MSRTVKTIADLHNVTIIGHREEFIHIGDFRQWQLSDGTTMQWVTPDCMKHDRCSTTYDGRLMPTGTTVTCLQCKRMKGKK